MSSRLARWSSTLCVVAGAALGWLWIDTFRDLDRWKEELRRTGVPAEGYVFDRTGEEGGTMYFRYQARKVPPGQRWQDETTPRYTYERWVPCTNVCLAPGSTSQIWYNPADPGDFVTSFDELSFERGIWQITFGIGGLILGVYGLGRGVADLGQLIHDRRPGLLTRDGRPAGQGDGHRLVVLVDDLSDFSDGHPVRRARTSADAVSLLKRLRGRHIHQLRIGPTPGDSVRPVIEWLRDEAGTGTRPAIERIVIHPQSPHAIDITRVLRGYGYQVWMLS